MRPFVALVAIACTLIAAGGARAPLPTAMEAPAWSPGDYWEYRFNSTFENTVFLNGTVRADILSVANRTIRGVPQDVYVVPTAGAGSLEGAFSGFNASVPVSGLWNLTGEQLFSTTSRKVVKSLIDITASGQAMILNVPFTLVWINSTSSRVARDDWVYPVPVGFTGTVTLNSSLSEDIFLQLDSNPPLNFTSSVEAQVAFTASLPAISRVTVPLGTFDTYTIRESWPDGSREEFEFAPQVGNNARTTTYNASGAEVSRTELVSYAYRAAAPSSNPLGAYLVFAGVGVGVAAAILLAWFVARRRRREREYTPPSLREPPTSGP